LSKTTTPSGTGDDSSFNDANDKPFEKLLEIAEERSIDIILRNLQSKTMFERAFL